MNHLDQSRARVVTIRCWAKKPKSQAKERYRWEFRKYPAYKSPTLWGWELGGECFDRDGISNVSSKISSIRDDPDYKTQNSWSDPPPKIDVCNQNIPTTNQSRERCLQSIQSKIMSESFDEISNPSNFFFANHNRRRVIETILRCVNPKIYPLSNVLQYLTTHHHTCPLLRSPQQQQSKIPIDDESINFTQFFKKRLLLCRISNQQCNPQFNHQSKY